MAFAERRIRYETLIRWHEDGRIGAQQVDLDQVLKDGVVISSVPTQPLQLGTADFEGAVPLADVLGEVTDRALVQVEQLTQHVAALEQQNQQIVEQANAALADLQAKADASSAQVESLTQGNQSLNEQLQAALTEIERLTAAQAVEPESEPEQA